MELEVGSVVEYTYLQYLVQKYCDVPNVDLRNRLFDV